MVLKQFFISVFTCLFLSGTSRKSSWFLQLFPSPLEPWALVLPHPAVSSSLLNNRWWKGSPFFGRIGRSDERAVSRRVNEWCHLCPGWRHRSEAPSVPAQEPPSTTLSPHNGVVLSARSTSSPHPSVSLSDISSPSIPPIDLIGESFSVSGESPPMRVRSISAKVAVGTSRNLRNVPGIVSLTRRRGISGCFHFTELGAVRGAELCPNDNIYFAQTSKCKLLLTFVPAARSFGSVKVGVLLLSRCLTRA